MRIHLREDALTPKHTTFRVFVNGTSCGLLTMENVEAIMFRQTVAAGCQFGRHEFEHTEFVRLLKEV